MNQDSVTETWAPGEAFDRGAEAETLGQILWDAVDASLTSSGVPWRAEERTPWREADSVEQRAYRAGALAISQIVWRFKQREIDRLTAWIAALEGKERADGE